MTSAKVKDFFIRYGHIFWLVGIVFIVVTLCSKCSFLYPFNDWEDSNCFFTVGKAMANGQVLYKDIYEQKGIYLYVLHILAYYISHDTFIGVYLFELVSGGLFAYATYLLMKLYLDKTRAAVFLPYAVIAAFASVSFCHGDSAEEFIMPLMAFSLLFMMQYAKGEKLPLYKYALSGAFAGIAFWVKFTLCGFFIGWIILAFVFEILRKDIKHAFLGAAVFLGAMLVISIPAFAYFGAKGALGDMFECYIYNNMFLYTGEKSSFFKKIGLMLWGYGISIGYGLLFYISIIPGFVYIALSKNFTRFEKAALFTLYAVTNFFIFVG
ncbi:MAG: glycosyltransferase family 39 protein, partial [Clostridia bacterium]|nr:glycosyltransferase family 39 protein [Clostridia bacterium]